MKKFNLLLIIIYTINTFLLNLNPLFAIENEKVRLPDFINAYQPAIVPITNFDETILFFDRKFYFENTGNTSDLDEIWFSENIGTNNWKIPKKFQNNINTPLSDVLLYLSPDGKTALVSGNYNIKSKFKEQNAYSLIYLQENGKWSYPEALNISNFRNDSSIYAATLSFDLNTMILALAMPKNQGGMDLYVSHRDTNFNIWSQPKALPNYINTAFNEFSPFLANDNRTLFFSSNKPKGYGAYDIYYTKRLDDSWENWSEPQNLGNDINTSKDDNNFWLTSLGESAYYVSYDTISKRQGIYKVNIPETIKVNNFAYIRGAVYNLENNKKYPSDENYEIKCTNLKTNQSQIYRTFPLSPEYIIPVNIEADYKLEIISEKNKGTYVIANVFNIKEPKIFNVDLIVKNDNQINDLNQIKQEICPPLNNTEKIRPINNDESTFFFDYNSSELSNQELEIIKHKIILNENYINKKYIITSYADIRGSENYNQKLSDKRGKFIKTLLLELGINASQIKTYSYGSTTKFGTQHNLNRRVTLKIE